MSALNQISFSEAPPKYGNGETLAWSWDRDLRALGAYQRSACVHDRDRVFAMKAALETHKRMFNQWNEADTICGVLAAAGYVLKRGEGNRTAEAFDRIGMPPDLAAGLEELLAAQGWCIEPTDDPEPIQITSSGYRKAYNKLRRRFGMVPARDRSRASGARAVLNGRAA